MLRVSSFSGSSYRYKGPSSTENPSSHKCNVLCTRGRGWGLLALGSSMTRLGASSPPSVIPRPVKRDCGLDSSSSPPGRGMLLVNLSISLYHEKLHDNLPASAIKEILNMVLWVSITTMNSQP